METIRQLTQPPKKAERINGGFISASFNTSELSEDFQWFAEDAQAEYSRQYPHRKPSFGLSVLAICGV